MTKNSIQALDNLEKELIRLTKESLPIPTRAAIQAARTELSEFRENLKKNREGDKLTALYRVSQSLGTSLNLEEVLHQVMDAVIQLTGAERGFLSLIDRTSGEINLQAARNFEQESIPDKDIELSRTVVQSVIESGKGIVTTDAQNDPRFAKQDSIIFYSLRSILCAPLQSRGTTIGVIYVDNRAQANLFTSDDLEVLNAFASQAAAAIENAGLYTQTDKALKNRVTELETLTQIDMQLNENLNFQRIIDLTREWAIKGTQGLEAWVTLTEPTSTDQEQGETLKGDHLPSSIENLLSKLTDSDKPQMIQDDPDSPAYLITPIQHAGEHIGKLIVTHPEGFNKQALLFLNRLAARAATAIENARLYLAVQEANSSKSQFVSIVTHELRIPLTSIKGYTDLIQQGIVGPVSDQQKEFLTVIQNNTDRMAALISDLSDISRIERGIIKIDSTLLPLHGYVEETITRLLPKIEEKQQNLIIDIPKTLPLVYADPNRLIQILTNLISNAWKYTPPKGKIVIRADLLENAVLIEIIDNGIGISEDDQAKIFSQFFRSDSPDVREQTGWGLGLNVTKKIVEVMGGHIGMSSTLGTGSTFWFSLPISEVETSTPLDIKLTL